MTWKWQEEAQYGSHVEHFMKDVDIGELTSFLVHVYFGCTQRECEQSDKIIEKYKNMFESRISDGATEKLGLNARAEQEGPVFGRTGNRSSIQNPPLRSSQPVRKCKRTKMRQCRSRIWIYS